MFDYTISLDLDLVIHNPTWKSGDHCEVIIPVVLLWALVKLEHKCRQSRVVTRIGHTRLQIIAIGAADDAGIRSNESVCHIKLSRSQSSASKNKLEPCREGPREGRADINMYLKTT